MTIMTDNFTDIQTILKQLDKNAYFFDKIRTFSTKNRTQTGLTLTQNIFEDRWILADLSCRSESSNLSLVVLDQYIFLQFRCSFAAFLFNIVK